MPASEARAVGAESTSLRRNLKILSWLLQILIAVILGQTLFFKFTGAREAKYIFGTLGVEPWGRYLTGSFELFTVILILVPRTVIVGALMAIGLMFGAIASHLGPLGIEVLDDGGLLFGLSITTLVAATGVLVIRRRQIGPMLRRFLPSQR